MASFLSWKRSQDPLWQLLILESIVCSNSLSSRLFHSPGNYYPSLRIQKVWQINLFFLLCVFIDKSFEAFTTGSFLGEKLWWHLIASICIPESDHQSENWDSYQGQCLLVGNNDNSSVYTWGEPALAAQQLYQRRLYIDQLRKCNRNTNTSILIICLGEGGFFLPPHLP